MLLAHFILSIFQNQYNFSTNIKMTFSFSDKKIRNIFVTDILLHGANLYQLQRKAMGLLFFTKGIMQIMWTCLFHKLCYIHAKLAMASQIYVLINIMVFHDNYNTMKLIQWVKNNCQTCGLHMHHHIPLGLCDQKQASQAGISNYIPQQTVGSNYLSLPDKPASGNGALIYWCMYFWTVFRVID